MKGGENMKDAMIAYLEKHHQTNDRPITRLYFTVDGKRDFVEDLHILLTA
jgi:hypothetical protein